MYLLVPRTLHFITRSREVPLKILLVQAGHKIMVTQFKVPVLDEVERYSACAVSVDIDGSTDTHRQQCRFPSREGHLA